MSEIVYLNGKFVALEQAVVPVLDRGFIFGDGVYEVIPVYSRHAFRLPEHLLRLQHSLDGITLWPTGATPIILPVTFTVTAAPAITLAPSGLSYAATQGAANPANQNVSLTNSGGTLNWTVNDDAPWLTVSPTSGSGRRTLTTSVNTSGLSAGTYNATVTVSAAGASSKTVAITLTVNAPATSSATLTWNANTESDLVGYKIYRATTSGGYGAPIATLQGNVTNYIAAGLQSGTTYFFVITSYDSAGNESPRSNEVSKSVF